MRIKNYIPNTITCLNLVSGCVASVMALEGNLMYAVVWIMLAAVFDFFDGIGKELDSLADVVSFGVAPGMILFVLLSWLAPTLPLGGLNEYIPYWAFVIPAFSGLRLAKFNIDERQTTSFIGLPVPAHALFWSSLGYSVQPLLPQGGVALLVGLMVLALITSLLLVSEVPMFSLKIKSLAWKGNELRYILVACAVIFVSIWGFLGIAGTILLYVLLSIFNGRR